MSSKLFVGGLASETSDAELRQAFSSYGEITEARVVTERETGRSRGFGFVRFTSPEQAQAALQGMRGALLGGREIRVDVAEDRPQGARPPRDRNAGGYGSRGAPSRGYGGGYGGGGDRGGYGGGGDRGGYGGSGDRGGYGGSGDRGGYGGGGDRGGYGGGGDRGGYGGERGGYGGGDRNERGSYGGDRGGYSSGDRPSRPRPPDSGDRPGFRGRDDRGPSFRSGPSSDFGGGMQARRGPGGGGGFGGPPPSEDESWDDARIRRTQPKKRRERKERDDEAFNAGRTASRPKRQSGESWRNWDLDDEDE